MTIEFICDKCDKDVLAELDSKKEKVSCGQCQKEYSIHLSDSMAHGGIVDCCVICGKKRFYVQKDFNPRLGIIIFSIGVIFSYHTFGISLVIATIIDVIFYKILKAVTVCYHCRSVYRDFEEDPEHRGLDRDLAAELLAKHENEEQLT